MNILKVSTIKKYECSIRYPKPDQLQKIATALGISVNAFISNDIESVNDILFLLMKLERQANLNITGNKDKNGKFDAVISDLVVNIDRIK